MEAYFDNSATTRVFDCVKDVVVKTMTEDYGNAASKHRKGVDAERYIREARSVIAKSLKVQDKEIIFTSGGSESNNMALVGGAMANRRRGGHIISTNVEHPSVYNTLGFLEEQGFEVTYLPVDGEGHINLSQLRDSLRQRRSERLSGNVSRRHCFMWMRSRPTESMRYGRSVRASTCSASAATSFTGRRAWDFCI